MKRIASLFLFFILGIISTFIAIIILLSFLKIFNVKQFDSRNNIDDILIQSMISNIIYILLLALYSKIKTKRLKDNVISVKLFNNAVNYIPILILSFVVIYIETETAKIQGVLLSYVINNPRFFNVLFCIIVGPIVEEIIYRYYFYRIIGKLNIRWIIINSLIFSIGHYINKENNSFVFFVFLFSLFLINIPYLIYRSLFFAILTHVIWNSSVLILSLFPLKSNIYTYILPLLGLFCLIIIPIDFLKFKKMSFSDFLYSLIKTKEE